VLSSFIHLTDTGRLACPHPNGQVRWTVTAQHDHIYEYGVGLPKIIKPETAVIINRKDRGGTLANSVVFEWCDGTASTIVDALNRPMRRRICLANMSKNMFDRVLGKHKFEEVVSQTVLSREGHDEGYALDSATTSAKSLIV
jgi:hypothetical protein